MTPPTEQGHGGVVLWRCPECGDVLRDYPDYAEAHYHGGPHCEDGTVLMEKATYLPESAVREVREWARAEHENWFATAEDRAGRDQYAEGAADTYELVADKLDALLNNEQKGEGSDGTE